MPHLYLGKRITCCHTSGKEREGLVFRTFLGRNVERCTVMKYYALQVKAGHNQSRENYLGCLMSMNILTNFHVSSEIQTWYNIMTAASMQNSNQSDADTCDRETSWIIGAQCQRYNKQF